MSSPSPRHWRRQVERVSAKTINISMSLIMIIALLSSNGSADPIMAFQFARRHHPNPSTKCRPTLADFSSLSSSSSSPSSCSCSLLLFAKSPPISNFDLEAIEEFERELDTGVVKEAEFDNNDDDDDDLGKDSSEMRQTFTVPSELHNKRIDAVIASLQPSLSRSQCGSLITDGHVSIVYPSPPKEERDNNIAEEEIVIQRKSFKVESGMMLRIKHEERNEMPTEIIPQNLPLDILYEDEHMVVINKKAGMVVHPAAGNWDGTVVNALAYHLAHVTKHGSGEFVRTDGTTVVRTVMNNANDSQPPMAVPPTTMNGMDGEEKAISLRPGIVHRLDKGTTGVLVVAKTQSALQRLSEAFASRAVKKTYVAITVGNPGRRVVIDKAIGRHPVHRQRMRVVPDPDKRNFGRMASRVDRIIEPTIDTSRWSSSSSAGGRRAISFVDTLAFDGRLGVVEVRIETGRTHQIRVHLQDRRTPIYGDDIYGLSDWNKRLHKTKGIDRPLLHAHRLELTHPVTGERMIFRAPMAEDMALVADTIWPQGREERSDLFPEQNDAR